MARYAFEAHLVPGTYNKNQFRNAIRSAIGTKPILDFDQDGGTDEEGLDFFDFTLSTQADAEVVRDALIAEWIRQGIPQPSWFTMRYRPDGSEDVVFFRYPV